MSEEPARQSHLMAWTLSIVAVPVLYILSSGPLHFLVIRGTIPISLQEELVFYFRPLHLIYHIAPLRRPLDAYDNWWMNAAYAGSKSSAPPPSPRP